MLAKSRTLYTVIYLGVAEMSRGITMGVTDVSYNGVTGCKHWISIQSTENFVSHIPITGRVQPRQLRVRASRGRACMRASL